MFFFHEYIIFGQMRSVLRLFLIVADASKKLHRQKTHRSNEPESDYNSTFVNEKYSTQKTFQLHSQLTKRNRQNRRLHNSNYFRHDRKKKKQFVGVKIVLKLRKIPHISVKVREQLRKKLVKLKKMRQCLMWNGKFFQY